MPVISGSGRWATSMPFLGVRNAGQRVTRRHHLRAGTQRAAKPLGGLTRIRISSIIGAKNASTADGCHGVKAATARVTADHTEKSGGRDHEVGILDLKRTGYVTVADGGTGLSLLNADDGHVRQESARAHIDVVRRYTTRRGNQSKRRNRKPMIQIWMT